MLPLEDDVCPVDDHVLGELYRMSKLNLSGLVATIPPVTRTTLALFCYRRSHLQEIGLAIAAGCSEEELIRAGGRLGAALFARSREASLAVVVASRHSARRPITLASASGIV